MRRILALSLSALILFSCSAFYLVSAENTWTYVSGYSTAATGAITESDGTVNLKGYGYGKFVDKIDVKEGTAVSFSIQPKALTTTRQYFAVAFLNVENSYFGNTSRDTGTGFAVQLRGFGSYTSGCGVYYSPVVNGVYTYNSTLGTTDHLITNVNGNMVTTTYYFTITRKTQIVASVNYTWELKLHSSVDSKELITLLKDSDVSPDCFSNGLFVTAGARTGTYEEYNIAGFAVTQPAPEPVASTWSAVSGYSTPTGSVTETEDGINLKGYGYAKYIDKIDVTEGTSVSFNIQPKTLSSIRQLFAVAFLNAENSFFGDTSRDTGTGFAIQLRGFGSYTSGCGVYYSPVVNGVYTYNSTLGTTDHLIRNVSANMTTTTYYFTMTRRTQTVSSVNYTWELKYHSSADSTVITTLLTDSDVSPDCFASGLYVTAGVRSETYEEYTLSSFTVNQPVPDDYTGSDLRNFAVVRGYSSTTGSVTFARSEAVFTGYGGASYSGMVTKGAAVEFSLSNLPSSNYWYSIGLVNQSGVFWKPDGSESQGIITKITVSGDNVIASVQNVTATGMTDIGTIKTTGAADSHLLTLYKQDGKWYIALDADDYVSVEASGVSLGDTQYLTAGAYGLATMSMTVSGVYIDGQMTTDMFPVLSDYTGSDLRGFAVVRGFSGTQGSLAGTRSEALFTGYGGCAYGTSSSTGAAVEFTLGNIPAGTYWYSYGLVNKSGVFWKPDGSESQGIIVMITAVENNVLVTVKNLTGAGLADIGTLTAEGKTSKHLLAFFKQDNKWYIALDGSKSVAIQASSTSLGDIQYLTAGTNGTAVMTMTLSGVYLNGQITDNMKYVTADTPTGGGTQEPSEPDSLKNFSVVRGYSGTLGSAKVVDNIYVMEGYGGCAFSSLLTTGAAVEFKLQNYPTTGYWFSFGVVNQKKVFWKPDGSESQGLVTMMTVSDGKLIASVKKLTASGMTQLGNLSAEFGSTGTTHKLAFYKSGGYWFVALDGKTGLKVSADLIDLGDTQYLNTGASGSTGMKMSVSKVYLNGSIPSSLKITDSAVTNADAASHTGEPTGNFKVIRGFSGSTGYTVLKDNVFTMTGYGGVAYTVGATEAISVDFKVNNIPDASYWYSFGLVNGKGFWKPDGTETRGLVTTFKQNADGKTQFSFYFVNSNGQTYLRSLLSEKGIQNKFTLTFFLKAGNWYATLDGQQMLSIPAEDVDFRTLAYLCMGGSGSATMEMSVSSVKIDKEVADSLKVGTLLTYKASTSSKTKGIKDSLYSVNGGTTFAYDKSFEKGSVTGGTDNYIGSGNLLGTLTKEIPVMVYILAALAVISLIVSVIVILKLQIHTNSNGQDKT